MEEVDGLQLRVLASLGANLLSFLCVYLLYINYLLFQSYASVFLTALLLSEALWSTRQRLLAVVQFVASPATSPRAEIRSAWARSNLSSASKLQTAMVSLVAVVAIRLALPNAMSNVVFASLVSFAAATAVVYALDDRVCALARLHRFLLSDESLVAVVIVVGLVVVLSTVLVSLFILSARDAVVAVEAVSSYVESNTLGDEQTKAALKSYALNIADRGRQSAASAVESLQLQYNQTSYAPLVHLVTSLMKEAASVDDDDDLGGLQNLLALLRERYDSLSFEGVRQALGDGEHPLFDNLTFTEYVQANAAELKDVLFNSKSVFVASTDSVVATLALVASLVLGVVDFGVRFVFLLTVLFFLLSSESTVLGQVVGKFNSFTAKQKVRKRLSFGNATNAAARPKTAPPLRRRRTTSSGGLASERHTFEKELRAMIESVFFLPIKLALSHGLVTLCLFWGFNAVLGARLRFMFFASSLSSVATLFFPNPFLVLLPWCVGLAVVHGYVGLAVALFASLYASFVSLDTALVSSSVKKISTSTGSSGTTTDATQDVFHKRSYATGLSIFFGVTAFGAQGIVLGPFVVSLGLTLFGKMLSAYERMSIKTRRQKEYDFEVESQRSDVFDAGGTTPVPPASASASAYAFRRHQRDREPSLVQTLLDSILHDDDDDDDVVGDGYDDEEEDDDEDVPHEQ